MGRRNRKAYMHKVYGDGDGDGDGDNESSLEDRYTRKRRQMNQDKPRAEEPPSDSSPAKESPVKDTSKELQDDTAKLPKEAKEVPSPTKSAKEGPSPKNNTASDNNTNTNNSAVDKLRLKKQRRKELKQAKVAHKQGQQQESEETSKRQLEAVREERALQKKQKTEADNSATTGVFQTLRKGVQYQDIAIGSGPVVEDRKKIHVKYTLRAKSRYGKVLDSSSNFGFRLGRGEVIAGWDIGVQGMRQGGGRRFLIVPPDAGYGRRNIGAGVGGVLFFDVTVP